MSQSQEKFLWGILIGGVLGSVATLLTFPEQGIKLREEIMKDTVTSAQGKKKKPKTTKKTAK